MLSTKITSVLLFMHPKVAYMIRNYNKKISNLLSLSYNSLGIPAEMIADEIINALTKREALSLLDETIKTALGFLDETDAEIIKDVYFRGISLDDVARKNDNLRSYVIYRRNRALVKLGRTIEILGFDKDLILEHFDDNPIFISCAERASGGESNG